MNDNIEFIGSIQKERYRNGDFCIATMRVSEVVKGTLTYNKFGEVVFKGDMRMLPQREYIISGRFINDKKYGPQYQIESSRLKDTIENMSKEEFRRFLTDITVKGAEINRMYDDPRDIFKNHDVEALTKVHGIGTIKAMKIFTKYDSQKDKSPAYIAYGKYGFTKRFTDKVISYYSNSIEIAVNKLKENPYQLIEVPGAGFKKIDERALKAGIAENDPRRIKAFLVDYFEKLKADGVSWVDVEHLKKYLRTEIFDCNIVQTFINLNQDKDFIIYEREGEKRISLRAMYDIEKSVANEIFRLKNAESTIDIKDAKEVVNKLQNEQGWKYSGEQQDAIKQMLKHNVVILRGPGGVGKTTTLNAVIEVFQHNKLTVSACALAGKAAENITQVTGLGGQTIHRLIGDVEKQSREADQKVYLPDDVIILDELSMVNIELFNRLVSVIKDGAKLIMVGDSAQLDSIGVGVMRDMINSGTIPVITLKKIHRQAQKSAIITHSLAFRSGQLPVGLTQEANWHLMGELKDLGYVFEQDEAEILKDTCRVFAYSLKKYDIKDIQIITQTTRNCLLLNKAAQKIANPQKEQASYTLYKGKDYEYTLREEDKVINITNNYQTCTPGGDVLPIYNGNTGVIEKINLEKGEDGSESLYMIINFDGVGRVVITEKEVASIQLGYAITVHKSQGSTIPCVIIALPFQYLLNTRELVYTAITRASKMCYLLTSMKTLRGAIHKTAEIKSKGNLIYFLKELEDKNGVSNI